MSANKLIISSKSTLSYVTKINKSGLVQSIRFHQFVMMEILKPSDKPDHHANSSHSPLKARLMFMALKKLFLSFVLPFSASTASFPFAYPPNGWWVSLLF